MRWRPVIIQDMSYDYKQNVYKQKEKMCTQKCARKNLHENNVPAK